jgi:hypothetical protein
MDRFPHLWRRVWSAEKPLQIGRKFPTAYPLRGCGGAVMVVVPHH